MPVTVIAYDIPSATLREREHQKRQDADRAEAGDKWEDSGFVFTTRRAG